MIRLSDEHWERIRHRFPEENIPEGRAGRKLVPARKVLEAVLWILNTGAQWRMLPQCYPNHKTVRRRFQAWCRDEIPRQILVDLANAPRAEGALDETESFIDATFVMAKGGGAEIGPTKRGKGMKIMAIVDRHGLPLAVSTHAATRAYAPSGLAVLFVVLASGFTVGCAMDGERDLPVSLELPLMGTQVSKVFAVGDKKVPLPPGDWTVIGTQIEKDGARGFHTTSMLAQIKNNQLRSAVEIAINLPIPKSAGNGKPKSGEGEGWPTHQGCVRDDVHFLKVTANVRLGTQDCWWINHWRMHRTGIGASEHWKKSVKYLTEHKIFAPLDMIGVTYRLADKEHYLTVNYFLNPGFSNFEGKNDVNWSIAAWETSVWHPDQVKKDLKKIKYINETIAWGKSWHSEVKTVSGIGVK